MKIEVYDPCKKCEEVLRLRLVDVCGTVYLRAVDAKGEDMYCGNLAAISERGIALCSGLSSAVKIARGSKRTSTVAVTDDYSYGSLN